MVKFVCVQAELFGREWEDLLRDDARGTVWRELLELTSELSPELAEHVTEQAVAHTLELACNYKRRFLRKTRRPPLTLLWLVWSPPHVDC